MTLTLELPPELETQLHEAAARSGQDLETFATAALTRTLRSAAKVPTAASEEPRLTGEEFEAALGELEVIGAGIPSPNEDLTHSRDDIYFDHD